MVVLGVARCWKDGPRFKLSLYQRSYFSSPSSDASFLISLGEGRLYTASRAADYPVFPGRPARGLLTSRVLVDECDILFLIWLNM